MTDPILPPSAPLALSPSCPRHRRFAAPPNCRACEFDLYQHAMRGIAKIALGFCPCCGCRPCVLVNPKVEKV